MRRGFARRPAQAAAAALIAAASAACKTVGPDYAQPAAEVPPTFSEATTAAAPGDLSHWWTAFDDPLLSQLVETALAQNLDLEQAVSRIREARQREIVAGAKDEPQVAAQAQASRQRISENAIPVLPGAGGPGSVFGLPGSEFNTFRLGLDASWEIDLFGGTRRAVEAAKARTGAAEYTAEDLRVSLAAEVARNYLALRSAQLRQVIAQREFERQGQVLGIAASKADAGFTSRLEVEQQTAQWQLSSAKIPALTAQQKAHIHALGVLTGQAPGTLERELSFPAPLPQAAPPPPGVPSELLRRRPDVRAAERRVAAATADIGVATADLYPRFSLTAQPAMVSNELGDLLDWGSRSYSIGAGLLWPFLNGGTVRANIAIANERQAQALLAYRQEILRALQDVEDALSRYAADEARLVELQAAVKAAREARIIAGYRYRGGVADYTPALLAEQQQIAAEDALAEAELARAQDVVALVRALGGGWSGQVGDVTPKEASQ
jgi:NodT family efflux transporter outer membrane factor (OMF) lipoprotein